MTTNVLVPFHKVRELAEALKADDEAKEAGTKAE